MEDEQKIERMDAGELQIRQAFEEVTNRNIKGVVKFSNDTRKIVRELEDKIVLLQESIQEKDKVINGIKSQISLLQQNLFRGGTS